MKKREAKKKILETCKAARYSSAALVIDGEPIDAKPILAGIAAGIGYAGALLEDGDDDFVSDPAELVNRLVLIACDIAGLIEIEREGDDD